MMKKPYEQLKAILKEAKSRPDFGNEDLIRDLEDKLRWLEEMGAGATYEEDWRKAVRLFTEIEMRQGRPAAKRMFAELGAPSKKQSKKMIDLRLQIALEHSEARGESMEKVAERIAQDCKVLDGEIFEFPPNVTASAVRMRLSRARPKK
jgi:hypothetical protein